MPDMYLTPASRVRTDAIMYENYAIRGTEHGEECARAERRHDAASYFMNAASNARKAASFRIEAAGLPGGEERDAGIALALSRDAHDYDLLAEYYGDRAVAAGERVGGAA